MSAWSATETFEGLSLGDLNGQGGGSNLIGLNMPMRTLANQTFNIQAGTATSVLYVTATGYKAP